MEFLGNLLLFFIRIYMIIIFIKFIFSWFYIPRNALLIYIDRLTDPVLNFFRRIFPYRLGFIDLSGIVLLLFLGLLDKFVSDIFIYKEILGLAYFLKLIIYIVRFIFNSFIFIINISCIVLFIFNIIFKDGSYQYSTGLISMIRFLIDPIISKLRRIIYIRSNNSDQIYLVIIFVLMIILSIIGNSLLDLLYILVLKIRI